MGRSIRKKRFFFIFISSKRESIRANRPTKFPCIRDGKKHINFFTRGDAEAVCVCSRTLRQSLSKWSVQARRKLGQCRTLSCAKQPARERQSMRVMKHVSNIHKLFQPKLFAPHPKRPILDSQQKCLCASFPGKGCKKGTHINFFGRGSEKSTFLAIFWGFFDFLRSACSLRITKKNV